MKFGGRCRTHGVGGLSGMIMIGCLIVILITGAWIAAGDGVVPGETDPDRGTAVLENRQDLLMELMEARREIASGEVNNISSPNRFLRADSGETAASRNHLPVLNPRPGVALVAGDPDDLREVEPSGFPVVGWVFLVGGYRAGSGENPFFVLTSAACSSLDSGRAFDAHPEVAVERSTSFPLTGNGERVVAASSGMVPWALIANQQVQATPDSPGATAEEPVLPGPAVGLLCVVAAAGALVGRYAGYPAGKREGRK